MGEQLPHRDRRGPAVREPRRERGEPLRHRIVEPQRARVHERERGRGHDRLGQRRETEHRIFAHRAPRLPVGGAGGAPVDDLAVARGDDHGADDPPLRDGRLDDRIEPAAERLVTVVTASRGGHGRWRGRRGRRRGSAPSQGGRQRGKK